MEGFFGDEVKSIFKRRIFSDVVNIERSFLLLYVNGHPMCAWFLSSTRQ